VNESKGLLPGVNAWTLPLMALGCGVMVANIYLCQPLLAQLAIAFGVPEQQASLVAVACQVGYALGILLIVPLADVANTKRLVQALLLASTAGLLIAASSTGIWQLLAASLVIAAASVVPQVLIPVSTSLVQPAHRAKVVGKLVTGLILGILLSRTVSGAVAEFAGTWRAAYVLQALAVIALLVALPRFLPARAASATSTTYSELLSSLVPLLRHRELRLSMVLGFCAFAAFSAVWATLAFHLASDEFRMGPAAAGLFGLYGAPGALMAPLAGRLSDKYGPSKVNAASLCAVALSGMVAMGPGKTSMVALVLAVNLLDFGVQSGQIANQARIFGLGQEFRARLNTLYMVVNFAGGALGGLAGGIVWHLAGWHGVCLLGVSLTCVAGAFLALSAFRRS